MDRLVHSLRMSNHHGRELPRSRTDRLYSGSRQFLAQAADFKCIDDFRIQNRNDVAGRLDGRDQSEPSGRFIPGNGIGDRLQLRGQRSTLQTGYS